MMKVPLWGLVFHIITIWHHFMNCSAISLRRQEKDDPHAVAEKLINAFNIRAAANKPSEVEEMTDKVKEFSKEATKAEREAAIAEMAKKEAEAEAKRLMEEIIKKTKKKTTDTHKLAEDSLSGYMQQLVDQFTAMMVPPVNKRAEAAFSAAMDAGKPYHDIEMRVLTLVVTYTHKALDLQANAKATVAAAHSLADRANFLQANGECEMAQRMMIQAHNAMDMAKLKEDQAIKLYQWARALDKRIPGIAQGGQMAMEHIWATTALLQTSTKVTFLLNKIETCIRDELKEEATW